MYIPRKRFPPLLIFSLISSLMLGGMGLSVHAQDFAQPIPDISDLPRDPDFVQTWLTPAPVPSPILTPVPTPLPSPVPSTSSPPSSSSQSSSDPDPARVNELLQNFAQAQSDQNQLHSLVDDSISKYHALKSAQNTLRDEILSLAVERRETQANIASVSDELNATIASIDQLGNKVLLKKKELGQQKKAVIAYIQALYLQENDSTLNLLLSNKTFSAALNDISHIEALQKAGESLFDSLKKTADELAEEQDNLKNRQQRLDKLLRILAEQKAVLEEQEQSKRNLLEKTQGKEDKYQELILGYRDQVEQVEQDIQGLSAEIAEFKASDQAMKIAFRFGDKFSLTNPESGAIWPVDVAYKGISAYFHDQGYHKIFGFPHSAIDIPEPPETPIRAPANGVVLKVVDNDGGSYNYLVLYHGTDAEGKDITTVYGHLPKLFVQKGDVVRQGEIIALTGGSPGSRGTGAYYTGPHLHFEVRENGSAIDPLTWLP